MYIVKCYAKNTDTTPCLVLSYKRQKGAFHRARKAKETFAKVAVIDCEVLEIWTF